MLRLLTAKAVESTEASPMPLVQPQCGSLNCASGMTLVELIIVVAIVGVLASAAMPVAVIGIRREKERELRRDL